MTTEDQVLGLFVAANPVADPGAVLIDPATRDRLESVEQRSDRMDIAGLTDRNKTPGGGRWMAVAAAVVLLAGLGVLWLTFRSDEAEPASVPPEVATVEAAYGALNAGDLPTYLALLADNEAAESANLVQILINANGVFDVVEPCTKTGVTNRGETIVECIVATYDDFHGPAGIVSTHRETWLIDEDGKIGARDDEIDLFHNFEFNRNFWTWLLDEHRDVYVEIAPVDLASLPGWQRDPNDMLIAVEYVDEFITQSPIYPIEGSD